jgi:hypothetical protein
MRATDPTSVVQPWKYFANLDLKDAASMRRVAKYLYYWVSPNGIDSRGDNDMYKLRVGEMLELNRMIDEADGNGLLTEMITWFSTFRDSQESEILERAQEVAGLVNYFVRRPHLYPTEHARERRKWEKRYGAFGEQGVGEMIEDGIGDGDHEEKEEDKAPKRRTRGMKAKTTQATGASERKARGKPTPESLSLEERTNQAPMFEPGNDDVEEGAEHSNFEMRERSQKDLPLDGQMDDQEDRSMSTFSIGSRSIFDPATTIDRKRKITDHLEERMGQGSERSSSANSTPPFKRRTQRESTEVSSRAMNVAPLADMNDGKDDDRESSHYSSDDLRPHVSN